jgi:biopolymer transport protein ExbD
MRNKRLLRTLELQQQQQSDYRQVPVDDLLKVSRAISILQQTNTKLNRIVKHMHVFYEKKYKCKLDELHGALERKRQKIIELREEKSASFLFIVRQDNCVHLYEQFEQVNKALSEAGSGRVALCRLTKTVAVERALCLAVAKSKCGDNVVIRDNTTLVFVRGADADEFEKSVRVMFSNSN